VSAITLAVRDTDRTEALSDNYQKVWIAGEHAPNEILDVHVTAIEQDALLAQLARTVSV
jgi:hypothetical protein